MSDVSYYLLDEPAKDRLMKYQDGEGYRWEGGKWVLDEWVYGRVTGLSGDSDFQEITEEEAKAYQRKGEG